ncbi:hypothetical protein HTZ84_13925 [Haloterrigena sp. SYSU A558-1]|uniref:Uncharacterized protein n=1 Tax=Haloterrigena gelatinilytica TaxID=2741724 RepID=A0A8J8GNQ4_9EURY|nr:hypothetical protein [Haloterrigena gelatinilytica]NUB90785.1 hypothetical protein [Haloterrigena gelatinilytica]NUC73397.1 hypothetical protein [Haloterrigena gelatinilytica]
MSKAFQTVVKTNVHYEYRREAIDRLIERSERTALSVIVRTSGLRGEFRRRALEGLIDCDATDELEELAEDTAIDPSLRRRAADHVKTGRRSSHAR